MSAAERVLRFALLAYPKAYRRERGDELLATALHDGAVRPSARQVFSLAVGGVDCRARRASGTRGEGSVRAGLRLGAFVYILMMTTVSVYSVVGQFLGNSSPGTTTDTVIAVSWVVVQLATLVALSRGWWFAPLAIALVWDGARVLIGDDWSWWQSFDGHFRAAFAFAMYLAPAIVCALARPRSEHPKDLRSPVWALPALAAGSAMGAGEAVLGPWFGMTFVGLMLAWCLLSTRDPRLAFGAVFILAMWSAAFVPAYFDPSAEIDQPWAPTVIGVGFVLMLTLGWFGKRQTASRAAR